MVEQGSSGSQKSERFDDLVTVFEYWCGCGGRSVMAEGQMTVIKPHTHICKLYEVPV